MPQLEHTTFISQIFWLLVLFLFFYVVTLKYILRTISTILKVRFKKLNSASNITDNFKDEGSASLSKYDELLRNSFSECRFAFVRLLTDSNIWIDREKDAQKRSKLLNINTAYLEASKYLSTATNTIERFVAR